MSAHEVPVKEHDRPAGAGFLVVDGAVGQFNVGHVFSSGSPRSGGSPPFQRLAAITYMLSVLGLHTDSTYDKGRRQLMTKTKHDLRSEATRRQLVSAARAL